MSHRILVSFDEGRIERAFHVIHAHTQRTGRSALAWRLLVTPFPQLPPAAYLITAHVPIMLPLPLPAALGSLRKLRRRAACDAHGQPASREWKRLPSNLNYSNQSSSPALFPPAGGSMRARGKGSTLAGSSQARNATCFKSELDAPLRSSPPYSPSLYTYISVPVWRATTIENRRHFRAVPAEQVAERQIEAAPAIADMSFSLLSLISRMRKPA